MLTAFTSPVSEDLQSLGDSAGTEPSAGRERGFYTRSLSLHVDLIEAPDPGPVRS